MPKVVDHVERRDTIARAFTTHAAEHGFAVTSYARLAAAVGCSVGTIQHYFGSREELVRAAFAQLLAERDARIAAVVERGEADHLPIREMVGPALAELLPLDGTRRREHAVVLQLRVAAATDPVLAELARTADADVRDRVATAVRNGTRCGEVSPDVDPVTTATRIAATVQGLALDPATAGQYRAVLDPLVADTFAGRCAHHDAAPAAQP